MSAVERLNLRLLVEGQHHRMGRRIDIEADDLGQFLDESRIVRQLEAAPAMRSQAMRLPDRLDCRNGKPDCLGHRARRPVGGLVRRRILRQADNLCHALGGHGCLAGGTGLVAQQAIDAFVHEAFLPTPHAGLRLARRRHDGRGAKTVAAEQHDTGSPNMLLRAQRRRHYAAQPFAVGSRKGKSDTIAHPAGLARQRADGNPQTDSFVPVNPLGAMLGT